MNEPLPARIGRYEIVDRLGSGGMGVVYLARDPTLGRAVAVKVLTEDKDDLRARFAREARSVAALNHTNIVTVFDIGEDQGRPFIAMEFLAGETMAELIRRCAPVSVARKLQLMIELCEGLGYAHRNRIIHRDIKPANLMITTEGALRILDFGLARVAADITNSGLTRVGTLLGTPYYMSPEQIEGKTADVLSDIFAVGLVLYELLAYEKAFPGDSSHVVLHDIIYKSPRPITELVPELDAELVRVVERGLEKEREDRYSDLGTLGAELGRIRGRLTAESSDATIHRPVSGRGTATSRPPVGGSAAGDCTPGSGGRHIPNLLAIQQRRAEQIDSAVRLAVECLQSGNYEEAIEHCERVVLLDPEQPRALELLDRAHRGIDDRRLAGWLADARAELSRGALSAAGALILQSLELRPDSVDALRLEEELRQRRREQERAAEAARALMMAMDRARTSFADGALDAAQRSVSEALAYDANRAEAVALKQQIEVAIQARQRQLEVEQRIADSMIRAKRHAAAGNFEAALTILRSLGSSAPLVQAALAEVEAQRHATLQRRLDDDRRLEQADARRGTSSALDPVIARDGDVSDQSLPLVRDEDLGRQPGWEHETPEQEQGEEGQEEAEPDSSGRGGIRKRVAVGLLVASLATVVYFTVRGFRQGGGEGPTQVKGQGNDKVDTPLPPRVDYAPILAQARKNTNVDALGTIALLRQIPGDAREHAEAQELLTRIRNDAAGAAAAARQKAVAANAMTQGAFRDGERQLKQAEGLTEIEAAVSVYTEAARSFIRAATADLTPQQLFQAAQDAFRDGRIDEAIDHAQRAYQRDSSYRPAVQFLNARRSEWAQRAENARKKAVAAGATADNSEFKLGLGTQQSGTSHPLLETREAVANLREATAAFERAEESASHQRMQLANEIKNAVSRAEELLKTRDVAGAQTEIAKIRDKDPANLALRALDQQLSDMKAELAKENAVAKARGEAQELLNRSRKTLDSNEAIQLLEKAQGLDGANEEIRSELAKRKSEAISPTPRPSPSAEEADRDSILGVLRTFGTAYKEKNTAGLAAVYPRVPEDLTDVALITSRDWIEHEAPEITVTGATALVRWKVTIQLTHRRNGRQPPVNAIKEFSLQRGPLGWQIVAYRQVGLWR